MNEVKHGTIAVTLPNDVEIYDKAGKLDPLAVSRIARAPIGLGQACFNAADSLEKAAGKFIAPEGVTPEVLRVAGQKAEKIDQVIEDLEVILVWAKQSSLLSKADAYEKLRKLNDFVKTQGKYNRACYSIFKLTREFFKRLTGRGPAPTPTAETPTTEELNSDNGD
jgi:hypothetical protein